MQPEEEVDLKLVAADATLIFAFSFARTLSTILASPDFGTAAEPGWLAPIRTPLDPDFNFERASACLYFAGEWAVCWIAAGVLLATFASGSADSTRLCGPEGALQCAGLSTAFLAAFVLAASALCAPELPPAALRLTRGASSLRRGGDYLLLVFRRAPHSLNSRCTILSVSR